MSAPSGPAPREPGPFARFRSRRPDAAAPRGRPGPWVVLAAWGPCGFAPVAPGTFGTLGAIPLCWALGWASWPVYVAVTLGLLALGTLAAARAGRHWGVVDASPIVIDEVVGYLVTMAFVPFSWPAALAGFALFRLFDVLKPWPASAFDRVKSGFGVMMDDVAAGVFAWAALQVVELTLRLALGCGAGGRFFCAELLG